MSASQIYLCKVTKDARLKININIFYLSKSNAIRKYLWKKRSTHQFFFVRKDFFVVCLYLKKIAKLHESAKLLVFSHTMRSLCLIIIAHSKPDTNCWFKSFFFYFWKIFPKLTAAHGTQSINQLFKCPFQNDCNKTCSLKNSLIDTIPPKKML